MEEKLLGEWKKANYVDLNYVAGEIRNLVKTPAAIILEGEVGAGKTTFVQHFCQGSAVLSPTYSLVSEGDDWVHADLYRLKGAEEIPMLELSLYCENKNFLFFEWGEKYVSSLLRELPEGTELYLLRISLCADGKADGPRNLAFYQLSEF